MTRHRLQLIVVSLACAAAVAGGVRMFGGIPEAAWRTARVVGDRFLVARDVPYRQVGEWIGRVDVYRPAGSQRVPALIYMHGGGWVSGDKRAGAVWAVPFVMSGYAVLSVGYRLADTAAAPAAIEDVRCAMRWAAAHAAEFNIDRERLVMAGESAGGHLALMGALLHTDDGFDADCGSGDVPRVRAVLNVAGVTDVADLLSSMTQPAAVPVDWPFAVTWIGHAPEPMLRARRTSPMSWVRAQAPPVFTVHGDADAIVPFRHATMLHRALNEVAVANELMTLPARGHGDFTPPEWLHVVQRMLAFLTTHLREAA